MAAHLLQTTVIGSMQKPNYLKIPGWINSDGTENLNHVTQLNEIERKTEKEALAKLIGSATCDVMKTQCELGLDIITDGEMGRNNYIYPFCRNLNGFDWANLKKKTCRNGKWTGLLPCVVSEISLKKKEERSDPEDEWRYYH